MQPDDSSIHEDPINPLAESIPHLYFELKRLAHFYLNRERQGHTIQPTDLVHEAYMRLAKTKDSSNNLQWNNKTHFLALAARVMRQVLIDYARMWQARPHNMKRDGDPQEAITINFENKIIDLLTIHAALEKLEVVDEQKCRIVELRFFGGLTIPETAQVLQLSTRTIERGWLFAKAWLHNEIKGYESNGLEKS